MHFEYSRMRRLLAYFNPIARLGNKHYSILLSTTITLLFMISIEIYAHIIAKDPEVVGLPALFIFPPLIIYFSFRDGIRGGIAATIVTVIYYGYIINTGNITPAEKSTQWETAFILGLIYLILAYIIGWLKQTIDIHIEQETDLGRRLQAIVEQLPVGVIITNSSGQVMLVNKQLEDMLHIQIPYGYHILRNNTFSALQPLAKTLKTGKTVTDLEKTVNREGKSLTVKVHTSAIHNKEGKVIAVASIIHDITQQKELEIRKDDFINMASHELRSPLTSMKLYLEVLENLTEQYHDKRVTTTLTSIKDQTERLQDIVNDLLDVSRLHTGKMIIEKEILRIDQLVFQVVEELQVTIQHHAITIVRIQPLTVLADKVRISQVLTNLITNAAKYSPGGTPIEIAVEKKDVYVSVQVTDYGIGIAKDQHKKIFDRLYQVTDSQEKTFPGLGMGLYISKEIIKLHKGTIGVRSTKGSGSTFYFRIPLFS
ncbi:PAS domain S-box protein [Candidatus Roizmanbacteria bacterium]|nr:PAS domain S-box protein [Candidatus Roizmanbacteria bacterium]